ncbi:serine/threonine-protein kinase [Saccharothrix australiensis]|uniref:non-specific serine/threonine protein kinase n=1 Tax=Saccharothrix australiensis TaxID=2072 RepID=A0A495W327_9PSEU|nr:serine/threonine-protein kinase [Saccharothrix australiensis]RKT55744.1 serine/threonine protein kinase [Saccharothrix australiensis]
MTEVEGRLIVGRYRLLRSLGRGGMGVVWLAHDEYLHRDVAVKEIQPRGREIRDTDPEVRRTLREARAAAKLSEHPGVITVHDVVTDERGLPWIVMQLLSGCSLGEALDADGPLPADRVARIGVQVLEALDYAHSHGVLHRDVKPGNVMLTGDKVVLTDFGIAVIDGASVLTATGQVPGAPEYIAPERILGEEALPAADMWSVGIMLYRMLVGRTPFQRPDIQSTLAAALSQEPDPHPAIGRFWPTIQGLLRKKPAERWTARQAIDQLTALTPLPASAPDGARVRIEYPTLLENPGGAVTVVDATTPNTRTLPPPLPPPGPRPAAPDDRTLDPFPPRAHRGGRGPLIAAGVVLALGAAVATMIVVDRSRGDQQLAASASSTSSRPSTAEAQQTPLKVHREPQLEFEVGIPADWQRYAPDGPANQVGWESRRSDPKAGVLSVQVWRDTSRPGVSALTYLTDEAKSRREDREYVDFEQVSLRGDGSSADLEYTQRAVAGAPWFVTRVWAVPRKSTVYTVTFTLYTADAAALRDQWRAAQPLLARIRDSFRFHP